jgi:predicted small secreted protein
MKKLVTFMLLASVLVLAGCNTWRGFGEDLEKAGEKIQKAPNN